MKSNKMRASLGLIGPRANVIVDDVGVFYDIISVEVWHKVSPYYGTLYMSVRGAMSDDIWNEKSEKAANATAWADRFYASMCLQHRR